MNSMKILSKTEHFSKGTHRDRKGPVPELPLEFTGKDEAAN